MTTSLSRRFPDRALVGRHDEKLTDRGAGEPASLVSISADGSVKTRNADPGGETRDPMMGDEGVQRCLRAHETLRQTTSIPEDLRAVPDRAVSSDSVDALGLIDSASASVTVDIALWRQPCNEVLDEVAWRRVFTWIVSGNPDAQHVSILTPPASRLASIVGTYSYLVERTPRYGILSVTATDDGWRIVDCWGLIDDAERIEELSDNFAAADLSQ